MCCVYNIDRCSSNGGSRTSFEPIVVFGRNGQRVNEMCEWAGATSGCRMPSRDRETREQYAIRRRDVIHSFCLRAYAYPFGRLVGRAITTRAFHKIILTPVYASDTTLNISST